MVIIMNENEYELIPHREILELKEQIEELKKQKGLADQGVEADIEITNKELYDSMNRLTDGINHLIKLFRKSGEELSKYEESDAYVKKLVPVEKKVDEALEQNKKIARGILAIADSIKDHLEKLDDSFTEKIKDLQNMMRTPAPLQPIPAEPSMGSGNEVPGEAPSSFPGGAVPPPPIPPPLPPK